MSRKKDANKYWIYGEDAALAAQFTAYLATVLKNRRLTYIRHLKKIQKVECSYEYAAETIEHVDSIREESLESAVEAKLMWEAIKPYLHKLSPKECEVMICLYIEALVIAGRPVLITLPITAVFVWLMITASYLNPMEFLAVAPIVPILLFIATLFGFVALAYTLSSMSFSCAGSRRNTGVFSP